MHTTQIYDWRNKIRVKESRSDAETRLMDENARLTRELAEKKQENEFLNKASSYFAKNQKCSTSLYTLGSLKHRWSSNANGLACPSVATTIGLIERTHLRRVENLDLDGRRALKKLLAANSRLNTAYLLKESFGQLWDYKTVRGARAFFERWKDSLKWKRLKPYVKFAAMVERHWDGIASYCHPNNKV